MTALPSVICAGCGLPEMHKMCVAHGTPVYMNSEHPAWGNRLAIQYLKERDDARRRLLSAAGDDLCRLSQDEIKELSSGGVQIPPKEEFLASCERFHQQIASGPGVLPNCLTLAQLIAENEKLRRELDVARGTSE